MENNILIAIIITFYNEEGYLDRCLQSVKNQTEQHFELILINDGSTDNSLSIAEKYAKDFLYVKLITTANSGHAEARNTGLKNCSGKFVTFFDADDELEPEMTAVFSEALRHENADLTICNFTMLSEDGKNCDLPQWKSHIDSTKNAGNLIDEMFSHGISETVWAKMFRTSIAKEIIFEKGLWFDDRPFLFEYLFKASTVTFVGERLLKIYKRNASITRRILEPKRISDAHRVFGIEWKIATKYNTINTYKCKIAKHQLDVLMDNFIIQLIDKKAISDLKKVQQTHLEYLEKFIKFTRQENIAFNAKDKLALKLMGFPKVLGFDFTFFLLKFLKRKRIIRIRQLKNS